VKQKKLPIGLIRIVLGIVGIVVAFPMVITGITVEHLVTSSNGADSVAWGITIFFAIVLAASICALVSGISRRKVLGRVSKYNALFGPPTVLLFEDVAAQTGVEPKRIKKDLVMADKFLHFDLYTDAGKTTLMKGRKTYDQYLETESSRKRREEEEAESQKRLLNPKTATLETFKIEGYETLNKIRVANILLPGEEISTKLTLLETTTGRIVKHVEAHPEKLSETRKLMNYHLPTTLKLVEKYCQFDTMEYQPQTILDTKKEIEKAIDTVNVALTNFLEHLFSGDTLDVSTDIDVLRQMLEKDGLTGNQFDIGNKK
jgi:hypothetical protein